MRRVDRAPSNPERPIKRAILNRLAHVIRRDVVGRRQVSDGARNLQNAIVTATIVLISVDGRGRERLIPTRMPVIRIDGKGFGTQLDAVLSLGRASRTFAPRAGGRFDVALKN